MTDPGTHPGPHPAEERLNEHADRRLPSDEAARVDAHLARCEACRRTVRTIRALQAELAALPREIQPERDLRPAAPAKTGRGPRHDGPRHDGSRMDRPGSDPGTRFRGWAAAAGGGRRVAAVLLLLVGGGIAIALLVGGPEGVDAPGVVGGPEGHPRTAAIESYERAGRALTAELAAHRDRLDPATADLLDRNLAVVETAIRELEDARAGSPSNRSLAELLESRHRLRLELLREAVALSSDS